VDAMDRSLVSFGVRRAHEELARRYPRERW